MILKKKLKKNPTTKKPTYKYDAKNNGVFLVFVERDKDLNLKN